MSTVVVTGGNGYLGTKVCRELEVLGFDVINWDLNSETSVDLASLESLSQAVTELGSKSYLFIHLAFPLPGSMTKYKMARTIHKVNSNLNSLLKPSRALFISSTAVYNTRMDSVSPWEIYGKLKLETEKELSGFNLSVFRPGTLISTERQSAVAKLYRRVLRGRALPLPQNGKLIHPFCEVGDLVQAICNWALGEGGRAKVANVWAASPISVATFLSSRNLPNRSIPFPAVAGIFGWDAVPIRGISRWHFRALHYNLGSSNLAEIENLGSTNMNIIFESLLR